CICFSVRCKCSCFCYIFACVVNSKIMLSWLKKRFQAQDKAIQAEQLPTSDSVEGAEVSMVGEGNQEFKEAAELQVETVTSTEYVVDISIESSPSELDAEKHAPVEI